MLVANVGDSRCFVGSVTSRGRVESYALSTDHNPEVVAEARRIMAHKVGGSSVCSRMRPAALRCALMACTRTVGGPSSLQVQGLLLAQAPSQVPLSTPLPPPTPPQTPNCCRVCIQSLAERVASRVLPLRRATAHHPTISHSAS